MHAHHIMTDCHRLSFIVLDGCYNCLTYSSYVPTESKFITSDWG